MNQPGYVLVDFWAPWCRGCQSLEKVLDLISEDYSDQLLIGKLNVDAHEDIAQSQAIHALPTLCLYYQGKLIRTLSGLQSEKTIIDWLAL